MTASIFRITDGIHSISFVGDVFYVQDWRPAGMSFKGDGYWRDSSFSEGRHLAGYEHENVIENIVLGQTSTSQNAAIKKMNDLADIVLRAANYSVRNKHGRRPVYLEVKASCESNSRYALVHAGHVGQYGNPFAQPFLQPLGKAAATAINLTIERGPWLEQPPGMDLCQPVMPTGTQSDATFYNYDDVLLGTEPPVITWPAFALWKLNESSGTTAFNSSVYNGLNGTHSATNTLENLYFFNISDKAAFIPITTGYVDIYSSALNERFNGQEGSCIAWVNNSGPLWTSGNAGLFLSIRVDANNLLRIYHPTSPDNSVTFDYIANGTTYTYTEEDFSPINQWFSVGMVWSLSQSRVSFYLDGNLLYSAVMGDEWSGSLSSTSCTIGAQNTTPSASAVSTMAYAALWSAPLTDDDFDLIGVPSQGFVTETELACNDIVAYVGNKRNTARLTHAFTLDTSGPTFGSNIIGATPPFGLLPATIGVSDSMYFGIEQTSSSGLADGPFNSIVLDIATPANATTSYTYVWEYWDGSSMSSLPDVQDNTDGFQNEGINSVHWSQPSDWATTSINSVTAYWVRLRVTAVSGTWTQPTAQDNPYTVVNNTLEIPASETYGSLPSLARMSWYKQDAANTTDRLVIGSRTYSVAPNFTSYINIGDEQNGGPNIVVENASGDAIEVDLPDSATGRGINLTYATGSATITDIIRVTLKNSVANSFLGSFKVFILYKVNTASSAPSSTEFSYRIGNNFIDIPCGNYIATTGTPSVHEIGEISIMPESFIDNSVNQIVFEWRSDILSAIDVDFYAFVFIPTDEWYGDFQAASGDGIPGANRYLSLDSTRYTGRSLIAETRNTNTDVVDARWNRSHTGKMVIDQNDRQIFHILAMSGRSAPVDTAARIKMYRNRRFHYGNE